MKLWQLVTVMDNDVKSIRTLALARTEWQFIAEWLTQFHALVDNQDREKLDYEMPVSFVQVVLKKSNMKCYLSTDGWLRSWMLSPNDKELSPLEAFDRFGGHLLEEAREKGSVRVLAEMRSS